MIQRDNDDRIDELESVMISEGEVIEFPVVHRFTDGMYIRQIFMPKGSLLISVPVIKLIWGSNILFSIYMSCHCYDFGSFPIFVFCDG